MFKLDEKGYQASTPEEILENLRNDVKARIPELDGVPAELRENLLQEGAVFEIYLENLITAMFNFYSPSFANDLFFEFFANERGLKRKGATKSETTLEFRGNVGSLIPAGIEVTTQDSKYIFKTYEDALIGTTGKITTLAYCDDENIEGVGVGALNKCVLNLPFQVTNLDSPSVPLKVEPIKDFKEACKARWRNPKPASWEAVIEGVRRIKGVEPRLVSLTQKDITIQGTTYGAFVLVVGGGDLMEIAQAIYQNGGLNPRRFLGQQSGTGSDRIASVDLWVYGKKISYQFCRPKKIEAYLKVEFGVTAVVGSAKSLTDMTIDAMREYINTRIVGERINEATLTSTLFKRLNETQLGTKYIALLPKFTLIDNLTKQEITKDPASGEFNINFDEYLVLTQYEVVFK